jgi:hypothetical protein
MILYKDSYLTAPNTRATGARASCSQDLRDLRDRDDVTPERFLALRGASAVASLAVSAGLRELVVLLGFLEGLVTVSLTVERRDLVDRFPAFSASFSSSSSSSVSSFALTSAFSLPLPLLGPVS